MTDTTETQVAKVYAPNVTTTAEDLAVQSQMFQQLLDNAFPPLTLHPVIIELMLSGPTQHISPNVIFKLPHIDPSPDADPAYCLIRQKSYEGYNKDCDKFVHVKLGRVLRQVFPHMPHSRITRAVEKFTAIQKYRVRFTQSDEELLELMLWMTENYKEHQSSEDVPVPCSCMTNPTYIRKLVSRGIHPYQAYAHALGWSMAYVPIDPEDYTKGIVARAMTHDDGRGNDDSKSFVRTYASSGEYQSCARLEHLLYAQGYTLLDNWSGYDIAKLECGDYGLEGDVLAPYVDGNAEYLEDDGNCREDMCTLQIRYGNEDVSNFSGIYPATHTRGILHQMSRCDCCYSPTGDDDLCVAGVNNDLGVCVFCHNEHYIYVEAHDVWIESDEAVRLHDGEWALSDDAVYLERFDEYYHNDHVIYSEIESEYIPHDNAVQLHDGDWAWDDQCWRDHKGDWHHESELYIEDDDTGDKYTAADYEALRKAVCETVHETVHETKYEAALEQLRADMQRLFGDEQP